jgi:hypothetical protein
MKGLIFGSVKKKTGKVSRVNLWTTDLRLSRKNRKMSVGSICGRLIFGSVKKQEDVSGVNLWTTRDRIAIGKPMFQNCTLINLNALGR